MILLLDMEFLIKLIKVNAFSDCIRTHRILPNLYLGILPAKSPTALCSIYLFLVSTLMHYLCMKELALRIEIPNIACTQSQNLNATGIKCLPCRQ